MLFSVIIPTYNRANFIYKTVKSVLDQTYQNFEVIVIDDGSTDNTEKIVKSIKDQRLKYYKKKNGERGAARNFGASKANGEYVTFLDSDDIFYTNHLSEANKFINSKNNLKLFFQAYEIKNTNDLIIQKQSFHKNKVINELLVKKGNIFSCHGIFLRKNIILNNQFQENRDLAGSEDYELWLRLASRYKIYHNPIITSCLIDHDERSVIKINKEKLIKRKELFIHYLSQDKVFMEIYGKYLPHLKADTFSYIALHLILAGYKKDGIKYFFKSLKINLFFLFRKRSLAIIKHYLFL
ncbi:MAG: glycosyltransferase family 2 protein [Bacteroidales bacterium]|nr:glycosyltransferase family 2 protein [Bacteroidales bacterium]